MRFDRRWMWVVVALSAGAMLAGCPASDDDVQFDARDVLDGDGFAEDAADDGPGEVPECPAGETWCGAGCRDLTLDPDHCGACDAACVAPEVCDHGACSAACASGWIDCGRSCVDADTDIDNCGTCGTVCPGDVNADPVCDAGVCGLECRDGYFDLDESPDCEYACVFVGAETCNGADDDCDGDTDEDFPCMAGEPVVCTTSCGTAGSGVCTAECAMPEADACPRPAETCNGVDDDCNGACDNGFACCVGATASCLTTCSSIGARTCAEDCTWGDCLPAAEACNGLDDNCDTTVDEGFDCRRRVTEPCTTGCGSAGSRTCADDCTWGLCNAPREICNGIDDDCDTLIDNGFECARATTEACSSGCATGGTRTCGPTCTWGTCAPPPEACNGVDDDCDGSTDETFTCAVGSTRTCTNTCGASATQTCDSACNFPLACCTAAEVCGNTCDDDCDTLVNEDCTRGDTCADSILIPAGTTTMTGDTTGYAADYGGVCTSAPGPDMVFRFTVPTTRSVTFNTCGGAAFDTVLYAYATTCGSGVTVACNDDSCGLQSSITFTATAGVTYYVVVDGYGSSSAGPITLNITGL